MGKKVLYHGSSKIIRTPFYGKGKRYNDYGRGFYCTEHVELAKEWACTGNTIGYVNQYEIETDGLNVLNLFSAEYTILHWLALLTEHRRMRISTSVMQHGIAWLHDNFKIDLNGYDAIIGYCADDSYFSFARAFLRNDISLPQLTYAMELGKLREQFVLKSEKAFGSIYFVSYEAVDHAEYYARRKARDDQVRTAFQEKLDSDKLEGLYIQDIIREEVRPNDPRLQ